MSEILMNERTEIRLILEIVKELLAILGHERATGIRIHQIRGKHMAITGVPLGGSGTFQETPTPAGSKYPAGVVPAWSTTDTNVSLVPSADGTTVVATVAAADTDTSFPLTCTAGTLTATVTVPIVAAVATGIQIDQIA